jgi:glycosyltransferase involved in cell wall biosynthesis
MRVLMLSWEYPPHIVGGLGVHVANLSPELVAEGVEVHVLTPLLRGGSLEETPLEGMHVVRVELPPLEHASFTSFVAHANYHLEQAAYALTANVGRFDLIHTHDWLTSTAAIALKQRWYSPLIATIHATERGRGRGTLNGDQAIHIDSLEYQLTYEAWRIIVCSMFMTKQLFDNFQTPRDKLDIIPNGSSIHPDPFRDEEDRRSFRQHYAADDEHIIFYVGRIVYEKGLHILLDALPRISSQVKARLVIAGVGPYLDSLKAQANMLHIQDRVTFTGFITDEERDRLYHVADVTTFPSLYEPFGIVVLEAYAAQSPVVVSQTGGLMEVVRPNETGITVIPGNADSLTWGIVQTLRNPEETQIRIVNALQELHERYNWRQIAHETNAVYTRVHREWKESSWAKNAPPCPDHHPNGNGDAMWRCAG